MVEPDHTPNSCAAEKPSQMSTTLRLRSVDVLEDRFELRLEGWRKFHMVALSDLLASADSIDSG